jgi:hypothetical protein
MYDEAMSDRRRAEEHLARSVPISFHADAMKHLSAALESAQASVRALSAEIASLKRHEVGLMPRDFTPPTDPIESLGPKTQLAVEEFAAGDPSIRSYLIGRAALEQAALRASVTDAGELDRQLAAMITDGDQ